MSIEPLGGAQTGSSLAAAAAQSSDTASGDFAQALAAAESQVPAISQAGGFDLEQVLGALDQVNGEFGQLAASAKGAEVSGVALSPSQMINLTVECQEFMFHCELTANMATTSSNGLQQLFQEQQ